jgi:hypothetical protein
MSTPANVISNVFGRVFSDELVPAVKSNEHLNDRMNVRSEVIPRSYHELADRHIVEVDAIEQLKANLSQLEDLHGRLRFMMGELNYLLRKN